MQAFDPEGVIDSIYEAALVPDKWRDILDTLAALSGSVGTMLHSARDATSQTIFSDALAPVMDESKDWFGRNSRSQLLLTLPDAKFHSDADYFTEDEMESDWLYKKYLWRHGLGYAAATWMRVPNGDNLILSVERAKRDGPFSREAVDQLTSLRPHLARSALLASRVDFERIRTANQVFDLAGMPAAAINFGGKVLDCNALFSGLGDQVSIDAGNKLRIVNSAANTILRECLAAEGRSDRPANSTSRSLPLPKTEEHPGSVLHIIPVRRIAKDLFSKAAFFIVITSLKTASDVPGHLIQGLFDLSPTETRIAEGLANGNDVNGMASDFGVSRDTIRHHLKGIFEKTGMSRQSDVARIISSIPTLK